MCDISFQTQAIQENVVSIHNMAADHSFFKTENGVCKISIKK